MANQNIPWLEFTSDKAFWASLSHDAPRKEMEWGRIMMVLWTIWMHCELFFRGKLL